MGNSQGSDLFSKDTVNILEKLCGPNAISIDDEFWLEFVKIRLPDEFFHEKYYEGASALDEMVKKYFLRLIATNEKTVIFSSSLRYRTAPIGSLPCSLDAVLSLATLARVLLKQFCESFSATELIYHFECASSSSRSDPSATDSSSISVFYQGQKLTIPLDSNVNITDSVLSWINQHFPDEAPMFTNKNFALRRSNGDGTFKADEVHHQLSSGEQTQEPNDFQLIPLFLSKTSTVAAMLLEMCEFCVSTSQGSLLPGATPTKNDLGEPDIARVQRVQEDMLQVHATLVEILILLSAVIRPSEDTSDYRLAGMWKEQGYRVEEESLMYLAPFYYTFPSLENKKWRPDMQCLIFLETLIEVFRHAPCEEARGSLCMNFVVFLTNSISLQMGSLRPSVSASGARLGFRCLTLLMTLVFYQPASGQENLIERSVRRLPDPNLHGDESFAVTVRLLPVPYEVLLRAILSHLTEHMFVFLFYTLVYKNNTFRSYCLARTDLEEIFEPVLSLLYRVPTICAHLKTEQIPPPATVLCIVLLIFSKDRSIISSTSRISLPQVPWFENRKLDNISLSSLWILVLLRLVQWNFGNHKDEFFVSILAGIFANMAANGVEDLHWHTAQRLVDVTNMLAKTTIRLLSEESDTEPALRALPYRLLLAMLLQLQWSMIMDGKSAGRNPALTFTLMRNIPGNMASLPKHLSDTSIPSRCVNLLQQAMEWFNKDCAEYLDEDEDVSFESQIELLKKAAARMPIFDQSYDETDRSIEFFMPVIWRSVYSVMPAQVCWRKHDMASYN